MINGSIRTTPTTGSTIPRDAGSSLPGQRIDLARLPVVAAGPKENIAVDSKNDAVTLSGMVNDLLSRERAAVNVINKLEVN